MKSSGKWPAALPAHIATGRRGELGLDFGGQRAADRQESNTLLGPPHASHLAVTIHPGPSRYP